VYPESIRNNTEDYKILSGIGWHSAIKHMLYSMGVSSTGRIIYDPLKVGTAIEYLAITPLITLKWPGSGQLLCD
jgi:hypothetical protein